MRYILTVCIAASLVWAQSEVSFTPPVLGFFYDAPGHKVRAIAGLPGAARAIDIEASGLAFEGAWPAPGADYALAAPTGEDSLAVVRDLKATPVVEAIPGVARQFEVLAFSPGGRSAALFSGACSCIQVISGLPSQPRVARVIESQGVVALAISDDATTLAVAHAAGVDVMRDGADSARVGTGPALVAIAADGTIAIADTEAKAIRVVSPGGTAIGVMSEGDGLATPVAVAFDRNGRVVAADDAGNVHFIGADGSARATVACDCKVDRLEPALAENLFRLAKSDTGPLWMVDARSDEPRVFFVPVPRQEEAQ